MRRAQSLRRSLVAALAALMVLGVVSAAGAAPDHKTFRANLSPDTVTAGTVVDFALEIQNTSTSAPLGAVEITLPGGFDVTQVSFSRSGWSVLSMDPLRIAADRSQTRLQPGESMTLTLKTNVTPVQPRNTTYRLSLDGRQANNFSGTGNDLKLAQRPGDNLSVLVTGEVVDCTDKPQCSSTPRTQGNTTAQVIVDCAIADCGVLVVDIDDNCLGACPLSKAVFWVPPSGAAADDEAVEVRLTIHKNSYSGNPAALEFFIAPTDSAVPELCGTNVQIICSYTASKVAGGHTQIVAKVQPIDPRGFAS